MCVSNDFGHLCAELEHDFDRSSPGNRRFWPELGPGFGITQRSGFATHIWGGELIWVGAILDQ